MSHFHFLCFLLANTFLGLAIGTNEQEIIIQSLSAPSSNPPSQSPSSDQRTITNEAPQIGRKLGKHQQHKQVSTSNTPIPSPSEAPQIEKKMHASSEGTIPNHHKNSIEPNEEVLGSQGQVHFVKQHHHSYDKSIAGGGVILGGLATTFLVTVFCYIRATRRRKSDITA
ncbi:hypothetical protein Lal_00015837 [Lupinus albus]|uniref:Uncharacterized protein n=1 Tax=Lupinus albus TaxID=3870 RepID=A0A6A4QAQ7_LUPAL|nr:hypothetical protein Lalb_Chr07g0193271 [Lupinus albus]KAF1877175.1 hypothetical protein Lal_00015837 [Lupinus albus]